MHVRSSLTCAAVAVALVAAACGGGGGNATPTPAPGGPSSASAAADFKKLATDLKGKSYSAVYDFSGANGSVAVKGSLTTAQKPPRTLLKLQSTEAGASADVTVINDGQNQTFCSRPAGGAGGCFRAAAGSGAFGQIGSIANVDAVLNTVAGATVSDAPGQTIAGRQARCFSAKSQLRAVGSACFDVTDGLLLAAERENAAGTAADFSIRATSVSTSVDDAAFGAPYPFQALPGSGSGAVPTPGR